MADQIRTDDEKTSECFISVDVETSGPIPGAFSLLSIGACVIGSKAAQAAAEATFKTFYRTLAPLDGAGSDPAALEVTGLSLDELIRTGSKPEAAMLDFERWVTAAALGAKPVFVGLNAAFDWSFVNYYFHRFLGRNPFGFSALDIKSLYMGATGSAWADTKSSRMSAALGISHGEMTHHALDDAQAQAELFIAVREWSKHLS